MLNLGIPHLLLLLQLLLLLLLLKCQGWADRFGLLLRLPRVFSWSSTYLGETDCWLTWSWSCIKNIANVRNEQH
ncbi:uncharacterized protein FFB14_09077 [Fusarium fujikuroi]|nr:uncharacterized protein FFB14_09077 [Fusarium fujikuroi]